MKKIVKRKKENSLETVLVDMDNVLNDFSLYFISMAIDIYGISSSDIQKGNKVFDIKAFFPNDPDNIKSKKVSSILDTDEFWLNIPIKKYAYENMIVLMEFYDVKIVTTPWNSHENNIKMKYQWLIKNLPFFDLNRVIFESEKWRVPGEWIIDDKPETLEKFPGKTICFDYPYNQGVLVDYRISSWNEIVGILL